MSVLVKWIEKHTGHSTQGKPLKEPSTRTTTFEERVQAVKDCIQKRKRLSKHHEDPSDLLSTNLQLGEKVREGRNRRADGSVRTSEAGRRIDGYTTFCVGTETSFRKKH